MGTEVITGKMLGVSGLINDVTEDENDGKVILVHQMGYEDKDQEDLRSKHCADVTKVYRRTENREVCIDEWTVIKTYIDNN